MFIRKKKLKEYLEKVYSSSLAENNGANYDQPISQKQQEKNLLAFGYECGAANVCNAIRGKFKLED